MNYKSTYSSFLVLVLSLSLGRMALAIASTTWYVDGVHGSNGSNCKAPASACKTIGHAISHASSGDTIKVAAATYTENLTIGISLKIVGSGPTTTIVDGGGYGTVVSILNSSAVTLSNLTIRNGSAQYGAGVNRITDAGALSIISTVITGNLASSCSSSGGGGVFNYGTLTISNSTIKGNRASAMCIGGTAGGGGVINDGTLTITKSTISGNNVSAPGCAQGIGRTCTGGVASGGGISASGTLNIANSTISGNAASAYCFFARSWPGCNAVGGGIAISNGAMIMASSTLAGNSATCRGRTCTAGGGGISVIGAATIQNSIVANSNGNCDGAMTSNGYNITSNGYNLSSDGTCNFSNHGDRNNISDPKLGTLGNYGGPTQTIPLLSGSPAIDAGNPSGCRDSQGNLLTTDQRGWPRPDKPEDKTGCDIGAYERQSD